MKKTQFSGLPIFQVLIALISAGCFFYFLSSLLKSGYVSDDAYNSMIRGVLIEKNQSLLGYTWHGITEWFLKAGRLYPLIFYHYSLFYWIQSLFTYKVLTILIIFLSVASLGYFIRKLTESSSLAWFSMLALPTFFQFRAWHDPFLAFAFSTPLFTLICLLSFSLHLEYLRTRRTRARLISVALYLAAALIYELTYFFFIFYLIFSFYWTGPSPSNSRDWSSRLRKALQESLPYLIISGLLISLFLLARSTFNPYYDPNFYASAQVSLTPSHVLKAFLVQTSATFPLSYFFRTRPQLGSLLHYSDFFYGLALAAGLYFTLLRVRHVKRAIPTSLTGLTLVLLPSALIAISGHQRELYDIGFGYGYIFVFMQYFGLVIVLSVFLASIQNVYPSRILRHASQITVSLMVAAIGVIHMAQNRGVVLEANRFYKFPRDILGSALDAGLFDKIPKGAIILRNGRFPNDFAAFFENKLRRKIVVSEPAAYLQSHSGDFQITSHGGIQVGRPKDPNIFLLTYSFDVESGKFGTVFLGQLDEYVQVQNTQELLELSIRDLSVFDFPTSKVSRPKEIESKLNFLEVIRHSTNPSLRSESIIEQEFWKKHYLFSWGDGFYSLDGSPENNVRWGKAEATLTAVNRSTKALTLSVAAALGGNPEKESHLKIQFPRRFELLQLPLGTRPYTGQWVIEPGVTKIHFSSDSNRLSPGDPRDIHFGVFNFKAAVIGPANPTE